MTTKKHKLAKSLLLSIVFALPMLGSSYVAWADPAASNQTGLCYNQLAGTISKCDTSDQDANGKPLSKSKCYVLSDAAAGWKVLDCNSDVFSSGTGTVSSGVAQMQDKASKGCVNSQSIDEQCGLIDKYLNPFIKFLAAVVGVVVTAGIITGGIQYSTSAGDPQKAAKAKDHIMKSVAALVAFAFLWAFLEWLVPGGFLNG
jgi:hypothetical protein